MGRLARRDLRRGDRPNDEGALTEYLAFRVAQATYALPVGIVREIARSAYITPVPRAPEPVLGITSFRGRIVTVVDLGRRLGTSCAVLPASSDAAGRVRVLMIDIGAEMIGLLVDEVLMVHRLGVQDVERAVHAVGPDVERHVAGIARPGDGADVIILLDAKALVS